MNKKLDDEEGHSRDSELQEYYGTDLNAHKSEGEGNHDHQGKTDKAGKETMKKVKLEHRKEVKQEPVEGPQE